MTSTNSVSNSRIKQFENSKIQCLGKRDKSSAGQIDEKCSTVCDVINAMPMYYTTSSCSGRCFIYCGPGIKSTTSFKRFRVSHQLIQDPERYFDLSTLDVDPNGGGDHADDEQVDDPRDPDEVEHRDTKERNLNNSFVKDGESRPGTALDLEQAFPDKDSSNILWLRYEPFILHVMCRSPISAWTLMNAARPSFKNVGLTTWNVQTNKFVVAVWGDEGLDMPIRTPPDDNHNNNTSTDLTLLLGRSWLADQCNQRHQRNWDKMDRFVQALRELSVDQLLTHEAHEENSLNRNLTTTSNGFYDYDDTDAAPSLKLPRSYDVIGDVALLHSVSTQDADELSQIGNAILRSNKSIKIVAMRTSNLIGSERAPGHDGLSIIAGPNRDPLITTHCEFGIKCVIDLHHTFFSPRMANERQRLCQQVVDDELVLVLFCGVAMDALQLIGRTNVKHVVAVEMNPIAIQCAHRAQRMLERNPTVATSAISSPSEASPSERLQIVQGNVLDVLPTLSRNSFDRVVCPRPKEGTLDGDLGDGTSGMEFLDAIVPVMKQEGGICHWYDFCSDVEFPNCQRTIAMLQQVCDSHNLNMEIVHRAKVGSLAMRQYRICVDFRIRPKPVG